jgi:cytochrome P450
MFVADIFGGGEDTTEITLSWAIAILCKYLQVQKNIQEELDAFIKEHGKVPTFSQREQVPYTISVMKECMCVRPITAFGVPIETTKDGELTFIILQLMSRRRKRIVFFFKKKKREQLKH